MASTLCSLIRIFAKWSSGVDFKECFFWLILQICCSWWLVEETFSCQNSIIKLGFHFVAGSGSTQKFSGSSSQKVVSSGLARGPMYSTPTGSNQSLGKAEADTAGVVLMDLPSIEDVFHVNSSIVSFQKAMPHFFTSECTPTTSFWFRCWRLLGSLELELPHEI